MAQPIEVALADGHPLGRVVHTEAVGIAEAEALRLAVRQQTDGDGEARLVAHAVLDGLSVTASRSPSSSRSDRSCDCRSPLYRPDRLRGHRFRVLGFPAGMQDGLWAGGELRDRQGTRWLQMQADPHDPPIAAGFSGAPVWAEDVGAVVGMTS